MPGRWLVLADDLTGAADCAIAFARRGYATAVTWGEEAPTPSGGLAVLAYDADSRGLPAEAAAQRHAEVLDRLLEPDRILFKKIDSTLRGQPAAETVAAIACQTARAGSAFGILAPAFPATGRTTVAGRIRVDGRPLEDAEVWRRDHTYPSADLAEMLGSVGIRSAVVPLETVRGPALAAVLAGIAAAGTGVAICDAETDDDLGRIAAGAPANRPATFFIGSAGLAHALAAADIPTTGEPIRTAPGQHGTLIVVGSLATASRVAACKLAALKDVAYLPASPETLLHDPTGRTALAARVAQVTTAGGDVLVEIAIDGTLDTILGPRLVRGLADALAPVAPQIGALAVTGGETAAALLACCGVGGIRLVDEIEPGVSLGLTLGQLSIPIATKAGAFGDADTLIRITERLRAVRKTGSFA
ncbi:four-carbon acid sugar kinase family protein [Methylobacterium sp. WL64]|uniref:four-carbon acid sugar kinase family protein n=1 Tax=Methylobacterium sp. WL64 TaxID=2603894 RepID=UPI0011C71BA0|nr:four-carbon acid sugar kinase family protein [Methylobacterium sp. WL64]TXN00750.1 four-carbon acid sugar kinase family protein [Methylobacterium sp. WL64]